MAFLEKADFETHIYFEVLDAITRATDSIFEKAISTAEAEAKGYLSKYNLTTLFGATGAARDNMLLMVCKDLTCWHFVVLAAANLDVAMYRTRYEDAIRWLKDVQCGKVVPYNWPLGVDSSGNEKQHFDVTSNPRRETIY